MLENKNVLFITLDSCRFDTTKKAHIHNIQSIGKIRKALTHGTYTVPAHTAFFAGHLPIVLNKPLLPYYSESKKQLWRIQTGLSRDKKPIGLLLNGNNIFQGYKKLGYYVLGVGGVGGVTQFNNNSILRKYFSDNFLYYGPKLDEEPLSPRKKENFPSYHIETIVNKVKKHDKWFLFINCPETHYPYDTGKGIPEKILKNFPKLRQQLNLRETNENFLNQGYASLLHKMQIEALKSIDFFIGKLIRSLPKKKNLLIVVCGDHGENFGEFFQGKRRWGHLFPSTQVLEVPLIIGEKNYDN